MAIVQRFIRTIRGVLRRLCRRSPARRVADRLQVIDASGEVVRLPCSILGGGDIADDSQFHNLRRPSIASAPQMTFEKT